MIVIIIIIIIIIINYKITFKMQLWSEGYLKFDYQISIIIHVALLLNTCDWSLFHLSMRKRQRLYFLANSYYLSRNHTIKVHCSSCCLAVSFYIVDQTIFFSFNYHFSISSAWWSSCDGCNRCWEETGNDLFQVHWWDERDGPTDSKGSNSSITLVCHVVARAWILWKW